MVLAQVLITGVLMGGIYGLIAVGLTLIFGVMNIVNFAHGTFMMLAMYLTFWLWKLYGLDPYLAALVVAPALFLVGAAVQYVLVERIIDAPPHNQLLLTLGISLFLMNAAQVVWTSDFRSIQTQYTGVALYAGDLAVSVPRLLAFAAAIVVNTSLFLLLKHTDFGKAIRAASEEREGAALVGIDLRRIRIATFGLGVALVAIGGAVITPFFHINPDVGETFTLLAFIVVVLGGLGNAAGALVAGLVVGVAEAIGAIVLPGSLKQLLIFFVFVLFLAFRPTGILRGAVSGE